MPGSAVKTVQKVTEELCHAVLRSPSGSLQEDRAWKLLLLRERLLFFAPLQHSKAAKKNEHDQEAKCRLVRARATALMAGNWEQLLKDSRPQEEGFSGPEAQAAASEAQDLLLTR